MTHNSVPLGEANTVTGGTELGFVIALVCTQMSMFPLKQTTSSTLHDDWSYHGS